MNRREFVGLLGCVVVGSLPGVAQSPNRPGVALMFTGAAVSEMAGPDPAFAPVRAFVHELRDLGWREGSTIAIERLTLEGNPQRAAAAFRTRGHTRYFRPGMRPCGRSRRQGEHGIHRPRCDRRAGQCTCHACHRCALMAHAQSGYPNRPIQLVVTVPPGGAADFVARLKTGAPMNEADRASFFGGTARGYTDYPALKVAA